jgi:hypothetical protein
MAKYMPAKGDSWFRMAATIIIFTAKTSPNDFALLFLVGTSTCSKVLTARKKW